MKIIIFLILILIFYSNLYSQEITLNFVPASSSEKIDSILVKEVASGDTIVLKNLSEFQVNAQKGTLFHFEIYSGENITVVADTPNDSKEYKVEFHKCQDKDGRNYKIVQIGDQWWMAENYAYLPEVSSPSTLSRFEPKYYVYGINDTILADVKNMESYKRHGALYNWIAAKENCPEGWHLPTYEEWRKLSNYINKRKGPFDIVDNESHVVGHYLKSSSDWIYDGNGSDEFGFTALPSGFYWAESSFISQKYGCRFWADGGTNTHNGDTNVIETYYFSLYYFFDILFEHQSYRDGGYSLRAIKN